MTRSLSFLFLLGLAGFLQACTVRETTTPRTATEVLLLSTAAERAIRNYDASPLAGKTIALDMSRYVGVDKNYVVSSLRTQVVAKGGRLVKDLRATKPDAKAPDVVIEVRNGTFGIWDGDFAIGIPSAPVSYPGFEDQEFTTPGWYLLRRSSQQSYCKLQLYAYEPETMKVLQREQALWGHAYYNVWWVLGFGPITGSEDIYPESME